MSDGLCHAVAGSQSELGKVIAAAHFVGLSAGKVTGIQPAAGLPNCNGPLLGWVLASPFLSRSDQGGLPRLGNLLANECSIEQGV